MTTTRPAPVTSLSARRGRGAVLTGAAALGAGAVLLVLVAGWHVTQGTSGIGAADLLALITGSGDPAVGDVLVASRLPRMLAGLVVGVALGVSGAVFQSLARNALASPDTLAVNAGAYFAVVLGTVVGLSTGVLGSAAVALLGGLAAGGVVLGLGGGGSTSTTRLVLAGSATSLALFAATSMLLVLYDQETTGLFAWGSGTLTQLGLGGVRTIAPVAALAAAVALALTRRMDVMAAGDDAAHAVGVPVRRTRVLGVVVAVVLAAAAVTLAGPIGFVGLAAPAAARLVGRWVPAVHRHVVLLPLSGLLGGSVVLLADAGLRAVLGAEAALAIPTGVTTTLVGAVVLVVLARRARDAGPTRRPGTVRAGARSRVRFFVVTAVLGGLVVGAAVLGSLAGYTWLLTGDVVNHLRGVAPPLVGFALDERLPRVGAALLAGGALALAGTVVQAVCRNPLAEPGILGITGGAGVGAVVLVTGTFGLSVATSTAAVAGAAAVGALAAFALVYGVAWRGGLDSDRLVLVGIGVSAGAMALTTFMLVRANPWDTPRIFTWLSGTTYDRSWGQVVPVLVALALALPLAWVAHRVLDLLAVDDDTPRLVGVRLERARLVMLVSAALLTSTAVSAVGVVGFVGLVAPHAARALVGGRHLRVLPVAVLLGALLLSVADTIGRTAIAPAQVPAGLIVALVGTPYFLWLLHRSRG